MFCQVPYPLKRGRGLDWEELAILSVLLKLEWEEFTISLLKYWASWLTLKGISNQTFYFHTLCHHDHGTEVPVLWCKIEFLRQGTIFLRQEVLWAPNWEQTTDSSVDYIVLWTKKLVYTIVCSISKSIQGPVLLNLTSEDLDMQSLNSSLFLISQKIHT